VVFVTFRFLLECEGWEQNNLVHELSTLRQIAI